MTESAHQRTRPHPSRPRRSPAAHLVDRDHPTIDAPNSLPPTSNRTRATRSKQGPALTTSRAFGQKSPVIEADIQTFLAKCMSKGLWDSYSDDEKQAILQRVPISQRVTNQENDSAVTSTITSRHQSPKLQPWQTSHALAEPPLTTDFCITDPYLKRAIARFKRDLADGYYEKVWQEKAKKAHQDRFKGTFDEYLHQHVEELFNEQEHDSNQDLAEESEDGEYFEGRQQNGQTKKVQME